MRPVAHGGRRADRRRRCRRCRTQQTRTWGPPRSVARADRLVVTSTGVRTRSSTCGGPGVTCGAAVAGTTDVALDVMLAGCGRTVRSAASQEPAGEHAAGVSADASWLEDMPDLYDRGLGPAVFAPFGPLHPDDPSRSARTGC